MMDLHDLEPFGVEARNFDTYGATEADIDRLRVAIANHGVLVLRDQRIDDTAFIALLERFGPLTFTQGETPLAHAPQLNFVTNANRTRPPRSVFHTDTSYVTEPPAFTALRAVAIPERGGATEFANQYHAFERLEPALRQRLRSAEVLHRVTGLPDDAGGVRETWHPLARRHPVSGRTTLFISTPERCVALRNAVPAFGENEVADLLAHLFEHSIQGPLYRHAWRPGDVVMWDNRCTLHRADHSDVSGERTLHRGMVSGEVPIAA